MLTKDDIFILNHQVCDDKFVAVSSFTLGTPYEKEILNLVRSLESFGLNHMIYCLPDRGDWMENCHHVIQAIDHALHFQDKHILWLDADARVQGRLPLFNDFNYDLGAYRRKSKHSSGFHWDTGTLFYANNKRIKLYVKQMACNVSAFYAGEIEEYRDVWWMLDNAEKSGLHLGEIPVGYSYIFDTRQPEEIGCEPLIIHHQASRRFKKEIND